MILGRMLVFSLVGKWHKGKWHKGKSQIGIRHKGKRFKAKGKEAKSNLASRYKKKAIIFKYKWVKFFINL